MTLPIDTWRHILGYHPFHFWQLANTSTPVTSACNSLVHEYAWQSVDAVGRNEVREAIATAEDRLREYLGYWPMPTATTETIAWPHLWDQWLRRTNDVAPDGRYVPIQVSSGHIHAVGLDILTLLGTPAVVYSDTDGDGLNETFTVIQATTATDATQIECYFSALDRLDSEPLGERWRIAPVKVTISGGVATIVGRSWILVKPIRYQGVLPIPSSGASDTSGALDPSVAANFVTTLDVVQHTTDPNGTTTDTSQAVLIWETYPCAGGWCLCDTLNTPLI